MYLKGKKVKGRGFVSGYSKLLPVRKPAEEIVELVKRLKKGDDSVKEEIILQHLSLVIYIVTQYVASFPNDADDLMGVAALGLTEAVDKFPLKATDDNICPYITSVVHGRLANFTQQDNRVIQVSHTGFEHAVKKAKEESLPVEQCLPTVQSFQVTVDSVEFIPQNIQKYLLTHDDQTITEVNEILSRCCFTKFEMLVYEGLVQDKTPSEISRELGYSKQRISQIKRGVMFKLNNYFNPPGIKKKESNDWVNMYSLVFISMIKRQTINKLNAHCALQ